MISDGDDDYFSLDTGISGNVLSSHYFDMNENHLNDKMYPILSKEEEVRAVKFDVITFNYGLKEDL